jgi:hypothetical protein
MISCFLLGAFFGCNGSSRDPRLFPLWTNRGLCRPANSKGNIWMRTRGGIPGFQCSFPGRGFHTSVGKEFTVSLSRQRDFSASDLCLVTASHASAEIPRLPPRLCQPQATHPPSCSPLTSRGCSLAGPRWGPCYHQTLCHLVSRCGSRASSYAHHLDVVPANLKMNLLA